MWVLLGYCYRNSFDAIIDVGRPYGPSVSTIVGLLSLLWLAHCRLGTATISCGPSRRVVQALERSAVTNSTVIVTIIQERQVGSAWR